MGIPAFFANIIKNYIKIIQPHSAHIRWQTSFDSLYMDCNSIIYDAYYRLKAAPEKTCHLKSLSEFEHMLVSETIQKIKYYISLVSPTNVVYITFDGVAPFAKMEQQRTRRYKSVFMSEYSPLSRKNNSDNPADIWSTINITPGTRFMKLLNKHIYTEFNYTEKKYGLKKILVSCSDEEGEGEHKLFHHLRTNLQPSDNVFVYGLDADLIMLSIFHCHLCKNIYVFREAPEFVKSKISTKNKDDDELLFMDMNYFTNCLMNEMGCKYKNTNQVYDFAFMCFLLGNDFLPHFPAINLRTNGMDTLLATYRKVIGSNPDKSFISSKTGKIQWKHFHDFIKELANNERPAILNEYKIRERMEHYKYPQTTPEEKEQMMNNAPTLYRGEEKYICPTEEYWEERYYKVLLKTERDEASVKKIANNYIEGLEWVFKYYTEGCPNWLWRYEYMYPPLLVDLVKYIPHFETDYFQENKTRPFHHNTQLLYVIPEKYYDIIDPHFIDEIQCNQYTQYFENGRLEFVWAFCKYLWEAHIVLKEVPMDVLLLINQVAIKYQTEKQNVPMLRQTMEKPTPKKQTKQTTPIKTK